MEFSSFFLHLLFFAQILQLSNTIVSSAKVEISAQNALTDKLDSLTEQMDEKGADIGKRLVQQRMKRDTDEVYIDHRQSGCLDEPRDQGSDCSASYAFATIAFYEWLNCQQTTVFQAFSEQYIIDCSHRHGNSGCRGGNPAAAVQFVKDAGLIPRVDYPYTERLGHCPYTYLSPYDYTTSLRVNKPSVARIPLTNLARYLEYGPIIVNVEIDDDFLSYRRGVDDNEGHTPELWHTMLLIGHGIENGKEYWLFRTSNFFTLSGDGHYKLNKDVVCFRGGAGIGLRGTISEWRLDAS